MNGLGLLRVLVEASGVPGQSLERELHRLVSERGLQPENVTLDDVREILAVYLQETLVEAKESVG